MNHDYPKQPNYDTCQAQTPTTKSTMPPSLRERLEKTYAHHLEQNAHTGRALEILTRHPEFSEFLELQQLLQATSY